MSEKKKLKKKYGALLDACVHTQRGEGDLRKSMMFSKNRRTIQEETKE